MQFITQSGSTKVRFHLQSQWGVFNSCTIVVKAYPYKTVYSSYFMIYIVCLHLATLQVVVYQVWVYFDTKCASTSLRHTLAHQCAQYVLKTKVLYYVRMWAKHNVERGERMWWTEAVLPLVILIKYIVVGCRSNTQRASCWKWMQTSVKDLEPARDLPQKT